MGPHLPASRINIPPPSFLFILTPGYSSAPRISFFYIPHPCILFIAALSFSSFTQGKVSAYQYNSDADSGRREGGITHCLNLFLLPSIYVYTCVYPPIHPCRA